MKMLCTLLVPFSCLQCSVSTTPEDGAPAVSSAAKDDALYQTSRSLLIQRLTAENEAQVAKLGLSSASADHALALLDEQAQAKAQLMDYRRAHPGVRSAELAEIAKSDPSLAQALQKATPHAFHRFLRTSLGDGEFHRYLDERRARLAPLGPASSVSTVAALPTAKQEVK
jgi:hypothetical protein